MGCVELHVGWGSCWHICPGPLGLEGSKILARSKGGKDGSRGPTWLSSVAATGTPCGREDTRSMCLGSCWAPNTMVLLCPLTAPCEAKYNVV